MPTASASEKCFSRLEVFAMMRSTSSSPRRGRAHPRGADLGEMMMLKRWWGVEMGKTREGEKSVMLEDVMKREKSM